MHAAEFDLGVQVCCNSTDLIGEDGFIARVEKNWPVETVLKRQDIVEWQPRDVHDGHTKLDFSKNSKREDHEDSGTNCAHIATTSAKKRKEKQCE